MHLELPQIKKRSTAEHVLNKLKKFHDLPKLILEYRKFNKLNFYNEYSRTSG